VKELDKIIDLGAKTQSHRCFVNDFSSAVANHGYPEHFLGFIIGDHLDHAGGVSDRACARYERYRNGIAPTIVTSCDRFLLGHANGCDLRIGEDCAWNYAVANTARLSVCERVVRGDPAILAAYRRSHLATDFAADHIAAREDVRHVSAQKFIHPDMAFLGKLNSAILSEFGRRPVATISFSARNSRL